MNTDQIKAACQRGLGSEGKCLAVSVRNVPGSADMVVRLTVGGWPDGEQIRVMRVSPEEDAEGLAHSYGVECARGIAAAKQ